VVGTIPKGGTIPWGVRCYPDCYPMHSTEYHGVGRYPGWDNTRGWDDTKGWDDTLGRPMLSRLLSNAFDRISWGGTIPWVGQYPWMGRYPRVGRAHANARASDAIQFAIQCIQSMRPMLSRSRQLHGSIQRVIYLMLWYHALHPQVGSINRVRALDTI
jgi:hypothetical protein